MNAIVNSALQAAGLRAQEVAHAERHAILEFVAWMAAHIPDDVTDLPCDWRLHKERGEIVKTLGPLSSATNFYVQARGGLGCRQEGIDLFAKTLPQFVAELTALLQARAERSERHIRAMGALMAA